LRNRIGRDPGEPDCGQHKAEHSNSAVCTESEPHVGPAECDPLCRNLHISLPACQGPESDKDMLPIWGDDVRALSVTGKQEGTELLLVCRPAGSYRVVTRIEMPSVAGLIR
jgi:hypothetical protein